jgi:hypothetical protein
MFNLSSNQWHYFGISILLLLFSRCASNERLGGGVHLKSFEGKAKFDAQFRDESFFTASPDIPKSNTREKIFREALSLDFNGDIYHPKLFQYRVFLDLGLEQRDLKQDPQGSYHRARLTNTFFDVRGEFLPEEKYTGDVYGYRNQIQTRQSFFPTNDAVITELGANARAKDWVIPSWLHYHHYKYDGRLGDFRKEKKDNLKLEGAKGGEEVRVNYRLESNWIDGNNVEKPYEDYQVQAGVSWSFGGDLQHSLETSGFYREQSGTFSTKSLDLSSALGLQLSEDLGWRSSGLVNRTDYKDDSSLSSDKAIWDSFLSHRLFDSLRSRIGILGFRQVFGDGKTVRNGAQASLDYRKETSFGSLTFSLFPGFYFQEEKGNPDRVLPVSDEGHRVTVGIPIYLVFLRVDPSSIRVTDETGLTIYTEGVDFRVQQSGDVTEIVITVGSRIQPGDQILVSYRYFVASDRKTRSLSNNMNLGFAFGSFADLRFYWGVSRQKLISGTDNSTLDDVRELGLNFELHESGQRLGFDFLDRVSRLTPYRRYRLHCHSGFDPGKNVGLNFDGSIYKILNKDTNTEEWGLDLGGVGDWRITRALSFRASASFKRIDRSTDLGRGWYVDTKLRYDLRDTQFEIRVTGSQERWQVQNDNNLIRIYFSMRRAF